MEEGGEKKNMEGGGGEGGDGAELIREGKVSSSSGNGGESAKEVEGGGGMSSVFAALHLPALPQLHGVAMPSMGAMQLPTGISDTMRDIRREVREIVERTVAAANESMRVASTTYTERVEQAALAQARGMLRWAIEEHPLETRAAAVTALVLAFPPTRRLLYRNTIGLVRSEEAVLKGYERQFESLTARTSMLDGEKTRLLERLTHAEAEFVRSKQKLDGALGNVRSLEREATGVVCKSIALQDSVRTLSRSRETLALQAQLAKHRAHSQSVLLEIRRKTE